MPAQPTPTRQMSWLLDKLQSWNNGYKQRKTKERSLYYDVAEQYLPASPDAVIVDIGSGDGGFADHLNLSQRYATICLLDANAETIKGLVTRYPQSQLYHAPNRLPFDDRSVAMIHSNHMVEHLQPDELLALLREIDRVLIFGGVVIISTPMLWNEFYSDLSHVRPYNPGVFINYLCNPGHNRSAASVSTDYVVLKLCYRYLSSHNLNDGWGSRYRWLDLFIQISKRLVNLIGIHSYLRNEYTLVLQKRNQGGSL